MGEENGFKGGKGCQGTYINNTWTKPKGVGSRVGGWDGWGRGRGGMKMETTVLEQQQNNVNK